LACCVFADFDLDSSLDLAIANGHIDETVRNIRGNVGYAQPATISESGQGTFRDATQKPAPISASRKSEEVLPMGL
jgi:hypothetical protein